MGEREVALNKAVQLQKELEQLSGGPLLHALRRIADLPNLPPAVLKTLDWTLRRTSRRSRRLCGRRASSTYGCRTTVCWRTFSSTRTLSSRTSTSGPWDSTCNPCTANLLSP